MTLCSHFGICGGCAFQDKSAEEYTAYKQTIAARAIAQAGYEGSVLQPLLRFEVASRRRVQWQVEAKALAYVAAGSHQRIAIDQCPILTPALQALIAPLNIALKRLPNLVLAVQATHTRDGACDLLFTLAAPPSRPMREALTRLAETLDLARLSIRVEEGEAEVMLARHPTTLLLAGEVIAIPPGAFLQAVAEAQATMTDLVLGACARSKKVADLFAGIGTYSVPLAKAGLQTQAFENDGAMVACLQEVARRPSLNNRLQSHIRDLFRQPLMPAELKIFDTVVINPPRAGARAQTELLARSTVKNIVMVSCNPATLMRDLRVLRSAGFRLIEATPIDQFIFSEHLEMVVRLERA